MSCKSAKRTDEYHGWECEVTGGACEFYIPNSKACAEMFGEGPDVEHGECETCPEFYLEEGKRCCKKNEQLAKKEEESNDPYPIYSKYLEDNVVSCGCHPNY